MGVVPQGPSSLLPVAQSFSAGFALHPQTTGGTPVAFAEYLISPKDALPPESHRVSPLLPSGLGKRSPG